MSDLVVHYCSAGSVTEEQRAHVRATGLYDRGDCILVWVNEGDFWMLPFRGVGLVECPVGPRQMVEGDL